MIQRARGVTGAVCRVLPAEPIESLDDYVAAGGGRGLDAARRLGPASVIDEVEASGVRGRGGAGFTTGTKWRTVAEFASPTAPATVVVNGAEGEPGTFKDRTLLRANPYAAIEGALIAALAVGADRVVIAVKATFETERARLESALREVRATDWADGVALTVLTGPSEYLFGEETALLEVLAGRPPFPRVAPPFRHGVDEVGSQPDEAAGSVMADEDSTGAPPTLANNVETMANVPLVLAEGADWYRSVGTPESPGTVLVTVSGATRRGGVAELALGTPLAEAIELIGGGPRHGRRLVAAMSGVANPLLPARLFATPLTYEDLQAAGSGLGAAGFIVFDDETDLAAVAAGVSRFLAVESCGQCMPCKQDGRALAEALARLCGGQGDGHDVDTVADRVGTVAERARCFLAHQHQRVLESVQEHFPEALRSHAGPAAGAPAVAVEPIVPIKDITPAGEVVLDLDQLQKQPDWSFEAIDSGKAPADLGARA